MGLNEKLEARRRELAIAAQENEKASQEEIRIQALQEQERRTVLQAAVDAEARRKLEQLGIELPEEKQAKPADQEIQDLADKKVEEALSEAAGDRMTGGENAIYVSLVLLGVVSYFYFSWWGVVVFWIWARVYVSKKKEKYKSQIISEAAARNTYTSN